MFYTTQLYDGCGISEGCSVSSNNCSGPIAQDPTPEYYHYILPGHDSPFLIIRPHQVYRDFVSWIPEIFLSCAIFVILIKVCFGLLSRTPHFTKRLELMCHQYSLVALVITVVLHFVLLSTTLLSFRTGYGGYLYDSWGLICVKLFLIATAAFVVYLSDTYIREHRRRIVEFPIIMLICSLLLSVLIAVNNLYLLFLVLGAIGLNLYAMIIFDGLDAASREAAQKYFYLSAISTFSVVLGGAVLYMLTGTGMYDQLVYRLRPEVVCALEAYNYLRFGLFFILLGLLFKIFAFPCHNAAPEIYAGSPFPVMVFLMLPVKIATFVAFLRLLNSVFYNYSYMWIPVISTIALLSIIWGGFAAYREREIIRLFGYAGVNQVGFLLMGSVLCNDLGLQASIFNLAIYVVTMGAVLLVLSRLRTQTDKPFITLGDFNGLSNQQLLVSWQLSVLLFSLTGVPPMLGFYGKYTMLAVVLEKRLVIPAAIILLTSVVSAYYYLRFIRIFWFEEDISSYIRSAELLQQSANATPFFKKQRLTLAYFDCISWGVGFTLISFFEEFSLFVDSFFFCADASFLF